MKIYLMLRTRQAREDYVELPSNDFPGKYLTFPL